jgi:hypothetical protein
VTLATCFQFSELFEFSVLQNTKTKAWQEFPKAL